MPRDSNYVRDRLGPAADWGDVEHLLAHVVDRLGVLAWQQSSVHRDPNTLPPKAPTPLRRPGQAEIKAGRTVRLRDMVRMMRDAKKARR